MLSSLWETKFFCICFSHKIVFYRVFRPRKSILLICCFNLFSFLLCVNTLEESIYAEISDSFIWSLNISMCFLCCVVVDIYYFLPNAGSYCRQTRKDSISIVSRFYFSPLAEPLLSFVNMVQHYWKTKMKIVFKDSFLAPCTGCQFQNQFNITYLWYKYIHESAPSYLCDTVHLCSQSRTLRSTSDTFSLRIPRYKLSTVGSHSFSVFGPSTWNKTAVGYCGCRN